MSMRCTPPLAALAMMVLLVGAVPAANGQTQDVTWVLHASLVHGVSAGSHETVGAGCTGSNWAAAGDDLQWEQVHGVRSVCETVADLAWPMAANAATVAFGWSMRPPEPSETCAAGIAGSLSESTFSLELALLDGQSTRFGYETVHAGTTAASEEAIIMLDRGVQPRADVRLRWTATDDETSGAPLDPPDCQTVVYTLTPRNVTFHVEEPLAPVLLQNSESAQGAQQLHFNLTDGLAATAVSNAQRADIAIQVPDRHHVLAGYRDADGIQRSTTLAPERDGDRWLIALPPAVVAAMAAGSGQISVLDQTTASAATPPIPWLPTALATADLVTFGFAAIAVVRFAHHATSAEQRTLGVYAGLVSGAFIGALASLVPLLIGDGWHRVTVGAATNWDLIALAGAAVSLAIAAATIWHIHARGMPALAARERQRQRERKAQAHRAEELEMFVSGLGHDLKTPLIALDWLTKDVELEMQQGDHHVIQDSFRRIRDNVGGIDRLVRGLLELTRIDKGEFETEVVDLRDVMDDVCRTVEQLRARNHTQLHIDHRSLPLVSGSAALYTQIFQNLVGNAIKYGRSPDGNVYVRGVRVSEDVFRLEVEDDGPGVPVDQQDAIFQMFQRGAGAQDNEGTGLGLALVRKVAEHYGGHAHVETPDEGGSRFVVTLPGALIQPRGSPKDRADDAHGSRDPSTPSPGEAKVGLS